MLKLIYLEVVRMLDKTTFFSTDEIDEALISQMLDDVYEALEEKGYNPVNQLVGYLISGDPGYISSHRDARAKITEFDHAKVLMAVVKGYLGQ